MNIELEDQNGNKKSYKVICKWDKDDKTYIVYKLNDDGDICALYLKDNKTYAITSDEEFDYVDKYLEENYFYTEN